MIAQKRAKVGNNYPKITIEKEPGIFVQIGDSEYTRILGANVQTNMLWNKHIESGEKALLPAIRRQIGILKTPGKTNSLQL